MLVIYDAICSIEIKHVIQHIFYQAVQKAGSKQFNKLHH
jgi:hypothetical protein